MSTITQNIQKVFVPFTKSDSSESLLLKNEFLNDAKNAKITTVLLSTILTTKNIRLEFYKTQNCNADTDVYVIMAVGNNDSTLMELGKKYNFPRGFPIVWVPKTSIELFGFYPKFENDERENTIHEFKNAEKAIVTKKFSGFLGMLIIFTINNVSHWTVLSKNSANYNSPFVQEAKKLFEPFVTVQLLEQRGTTWCAEILSQTDQTHGSCVLLETPVTTCISRGSFFDITQDTTSEYLVKFMQTLDMHDFCKKHGLPVADVIIIDEKVQEFLTQLSNERDFTTNSSFDKLITESKCKIVKGNIDHREVCGDRLEGLVIKMINKNHTEQTLKYKFPFYTSVTMFLRTALSNVNNNVKLLLTSTLGNSINYFCDNWCVSKTGKEFWKNQCMNYVMHSQFIVPDLKVGLHIKIADSVIPDYSAIEQKLNTKNVNDVNDVKSFEKLCKDFQTHTVILVIGPVGSGKTTFANSLCANNNNCKLIDGDVLTTNLKKYVLSLGQERNPLTLSIIAQTMMSGTIPVVACGGGVLFDGYGNKQSFHLTNYLQKALGVGIRLITILMSDVDELTLTEPKNKYALYDDTARVIKTVTDRKERKEYDESVNTAKIVSLSRNNKNVAIEILKNSTQVWFAPCVNDGKSPDCTLVTSFVTNKQKPIIHATFQQHRILAHVVTDDGPEFGHVTLRYDRNGFETKMDSMTPKTYDGVIATSGKVRVVVLDKSVNFHKDDSSHVTLCSGEYKPYEMRDVAIAVNSGASTFNLRKNNGDISTLKVSSLEKCSIELLYEFYL